MPILYQPTIRRTVNPVPAILGRPPAYSWVPVNQRTDFHARCHGSSLLLLFARSVAMAAAKWRSEDGSAVCRQPAAWFPCAASTRICRFVCRNYRVEGLTDISSLRSCRPLGVGPRQFRSMERTCAATYGPTGRWDSAGRNEYTFRHLGVRERVRRNDCETTLNSSWSMTQGARYAVRKTTPASLRSDAAIRCCSR
jgi:hypothetical protein